ncbi:MAG: hypothetical protein WAK55_14325 [Xanthobacteraceae bacterium]|jgi:hypothetical protein
MRKGAPFHGAIGADKTATSAASSQLADAARESTAKKTNMKNAPISETAVTATADEPPGDN